MTLAIAGTQLPTVDLTITFPTTRTDGSELAVGQIQSATILRDSGPGAATLTILNGPFSSGTATFADVSPLTGSDVYSFYVTDTAGTQGITSPPVTVSVVGQAPLAAPAAGTLTATATYPNSTPLGDSNTGPQAVSPLVEPTSSPFGSATSPEVPALTQPEQVKAATNAQKNK